MPTARSSKKSCSHPCRESALPNRSAASFAGVHLRRACDGEAVAILTDGEYAEGFSSQQAAALTQADFIYHNGSWPLDGQLLAARHSIQKPEIMVNLESSREASRWHEWADYAIHSLSYLGLTEDCTSAELQAALRDSRHWTQTRGCNTWCQGKPVPKRRRDH